MERCLYGINNTSATFEAQFIKKLSNTKANLKKCIAYRKKCVMQLCEMHGAVKVNFKSPKLQLAYSNCPVLLKLDNDL